MKDKGMLKHRWKHQAWPIPRLMHGSCIHLLLCHRPKDLKGVEVVEVEVHSAVLCQGNVGTCRSAVLCAIRSCKLTFGCDQMGLDAVDAVSLCSLAVSD